MEHNSVRGEDAPAAASGDGGESSRDAEHGEGAPDPTDAIPGERAAERPRAAAREKKPKATAKTPPERHDKAAESAGAEGTGREHAAGTPTATVPAPRATPEDRAPAEAPESTGAVRPADDMTALAEAVAVTTDASARAGRTELRPGADPAPAAKTGTTKTAAAKSAAVPPVVPAPRRAADPSGPGDKGPGGKGPEGPAGPGPTAKSRKRRRVLRWVAGGVAGLVLGTAGAGYLYYSYMNGNIRTDALNLGDGKLGKSRPNAFGQTPLNILLIGSDVRDDKENQALGGGRDTFGGPPLADVQMLLHVSADRSNMSVVSMPRDTMVKMPKCTDTDGKVYPASTGLVQVNESLGRGGPGCTVAAWQELTKIPIDHFMMIDFKGVVSMADAIGGVPVCVQQNVHSRTSEGKGSGLKLPKGVNVIQGEQALQWLRTRYGFEDGSDLGRTHAQHMYMNSMAREFRKNANLANPGKLNSLAQAAIKAMIVDPGLASIDKLFDLSTELKAVPTGRITMTTMPWVDSNVQSGRVEPKPGDAEDLFRMIREDIALDGKGDGKTKPKGEPSKPASAAPTAPPANVKPDSTPVLVRNATVGEQQDQQQVKGRSTEVAASLAKLGWTKARGDNQVGGEDTTVVRWASPDQEAAAKALAAALKLPATAVERSTDVTAITVFVGADWRSGDAPGAGKPAPSKAPDSARPLNGDDDKACMAVQPGFTW
ncbi:LCP family protein [Streptomyces sp. BI20]|uniref:LCP family protein n=1 Tax=Streptomyces sp. BI20 TaxID=3403460 RepID=UPI003C7629E8